MLQNIHTPTLVIRFRLPPRLTPRWRGSASLRIQVVKISKKKFLIDPLRRRRDGRCERRALTAEQRYPTLAYMIDQRSPLRRAHPPPRKNPRQRQRTITKSRVRFN